MSEGTTTCKMVVFPDAPSSKILLDDGTWVEPSTGGSVNINVDGSKGGTREQNDKMAKQIAREVREEVKKIIADERRYGGALGAQTARAY